MTDREILLATANPAKLRRLAWLLDGLPLRPVNPEALSHPPLVEENARSHRSNAVLKAQVWSRAWDDGLTIASDGGLSIPALGRRWNSLRTRRFAGPDADDRRRVEALLELMRPYSGPKRRVRWFEVVALAQGGALLGTWQAWSGQCTLATSFDPAKLVHDFWIDTLWYVPALGKHLSELSVEERERVQQHWIRLKLRLYTFFRRRLSPVEERR